MYTLEAGLAVCALALLSLLPLPLYTHLRSPIIPSTRPPPDNTVGGLAKRIVVIVADGLRADAVIDSHSNVITAEFLNRTITTKRGRFGWSTVREPTESRPAHGQLLCGVDEDPTALWRGWNSYPTKPDSVLTRASFAVAIGGPDVVPHFTGRNVYVEVFAQSAYSQPGMYIYVYQIHALTHIHIHTSLE